MSELTYILDRPRRELVRGSYISVGTPSGRNAVLKVTAVTHWDDRLEAWDAVTGHQVSVRIVKAVA